MPCATCTLAADDALQQVAYESAADHLIRALELVTTYRATDEVERCQLLLAIGRACVKAGRTSEANDRFLDAFELAASCGRPDLLAEAALGYGGVLPAGSEPNAKARALLESALAALATEDGSARALVLGRLAQWGHFDRPRRRAPRAHRRAPSPWRGELGDPETLAAVLRYRYWAMDGPDDVDRQIAVAIEIRDLGERIGDRESLLQGLKCELHARFELGDFEASRRVAADLATLADADPATRVPATRLHVGQPGRRHRRSLCRCRGQRGAGRRHPRAHRAPPALCALFRAVLAVAVAPGAHGGPAPPPRGRATPAGRHRARPPSWHGWRARSASAPRPRRSWPASCPPKWPTSDRNFHWWFLMVGLAQTAVNLGDRAWAVALYDLIEPYADHNCRAGQATFLGAASLQLGTLGAHAGTRGRGHRAPRVGLEASHDMGARPFVAMTKHLLATALRGPGARGPTSSAPTSSMRRPPPRRCTWGVPRTVTTPTL